MDPLEEAQKVLAAQPFSVLLGAEVTEWGEGRATLELAIRDELKQQYGFAHGGVVSYLADNALTYAAGTVMGHVLTVEMKINYMRPAVGERLIARAEVLSSGRTQAVSQCRVYAVKEGVEKLCAAAQGTIARMAREV
ncbi:MAG: PaaI family thioesterase [Rhodobacteraceae bacterium]|nr:PaaI family thioesterase [Paracoccaceae bacterium]